MKVAVFGAGIIGVTTAYCLARDGHEVIVVDRQCGPAMETSYANAGEISPGYASPWANPALPLNALRWLCMRRAPLAIGTLPNIDMLSWALCLLHNCSTEHYARNKARMIALARYSQHCLAAVTDETHIAYDWQSRGTLQLFRDPRQIERVAADIAVLRQFDVAHSLLDRAGCVAVEPALENAQVPIAGGLHLSGDQTGDCHAFAIALAEKASALGAHFMGNCTLERLEVVGGAIAQATTSSGPLIADRYILALGSYSRGVARSLGLGLPTYPIKGYSLTASIVDPARAPVSTVMDESYKVALTRLGNRIRIGGMAELSGFSASLPFKRRRVLEQTAVELFGGGADYAAAEFWTGLRPSTPDGVPLIGATRIPNLFLNTGHGTLGWTMACGSAQLLADILAGRPPELDPASYSLAGHG